MAAVTDSLDGSAVLLSISTNLTTPVYKTLVCAINNGLKGTRNVTSKSSKCGTAKSAGEPNYTLDGSFVANKTPLSTEMSHEAMIALFDSGADFLFKLADAVTPTNYFRQGQGFLSSYNETANNEDTVDGDFTIEVKGSPDFTS